MKVLPIDLPAVPVDAVQGTLAALGLGAVILFVVLLWAADRE